MGVRGLLPFLHGKADRFQTVNLETVRETVVIDADHLVSYLWDISQTPFDAVYGGSYRAFTLAIDVFLDTLLTACGIPRIDLFYSGVCHETINDAQRSAKFASRTAIGIVAEHRVQRAYDNPLPAFGVTLLVERCKAHPESNRIRSYFVSGDATRAMAYHAARNRSEQRAFAVISEAPEILLGLASWIPMPSLQMKPLEIRFGSNEMMRSGGFVPFDPPFMVNTHPFRPADMFPSLVTDYVCRCRMLRPDNLTMMLHLPSPELLPLWASFMHNHMLGGPEGTDHGLGIVHAYVRNMVDDVNTLTAGGRFIDVMMRRGSASPLGIANACFPTRSRSFTPRVVGGGAQTPTLTHPPAAGAPAAAPAALNLDVAEEDPFKPQFLEKCQQAFDFFTQVPSFSPMDTTPPTSAKLRPSALCLLRQNKLLLPPLVHDFLGGHKFSNNRIADIRARLYAMWEHVMQARYDCAAPPHVVEMRQGQSFYVETRVAADVAQTEYRREIDRLIQAVQEGRTKSLTDADQMMLVLFGMADDLFLKLRTSEVLEKLLFIPVGSAQITDSVPENTTISGVTSATNDCTEAVESLRFARLLQVAKLCLAVCGLHETLSVDEMISCAVFFSACIARKSADSPASFSMERTTWREDEFIRISNRHFEICATLVATLWHMDLVSQIFGDPFNNSITELMSCCVWPLLGRMLAAKNSAEELLNLGVEEIDVFRDVCFAWGWLDELDQAFFEHAHVGMYPLKETVLHRKRGGAAMRGRGVVRGSVRGARGTNTRGRGSTYRPASQGPPRYNNHYGHGNSSYTSNRGGSYARPSNYHPSTFSGGRPSEPYLPAHSYRGSHPSSGISVASEAASAPQQQMPSSDPLPTSHGPLPPNQPQFQLPLTHTANGAPMHPQPWNTSFDTSSVAGSVRSQQSGWSAGSYRGNQRGGYRGRGHVRGGYVSRGGGRTPRAHHGSYLSAGRDQPFTPRRYSRGGFTPRRASTPLFGQDRRPRSPGPRPYTPTLRRPNTPSFRPRTPTFGGNRPRTPRRRGHW